MALRNILKQGDPTLSKHCRPVTEFNERLHTLIDDMRETLIDSGGVGLAAPQVGVLRRVVLVMDISQEDKTPDEQIVELVNPHIIAQSGEQTGAEGCLSVPGVYGVVTRPDMVKVTAQDRFGNEFEVWAKEFTARTYCHELDHLDGKLFISVAERILSPDEYEEYFEDADEEIEE